MVMLARMRYSALAPGVRFPILERLQKCRGRVTLPRSPTRRPYAQANPYRPLRLRLRDRPELPVHRGVLQRVTARPARDGILEALVANHQRFLAFLERRVGSRETAEDILQDGFVRALERADSVRAEESAVAWFYRLLRNALADHYRHRGAEERALAAAAAEPHERDDNAELREMICACIGELVGMLKPEYATALRRVELDGERVDAFAREAGITATNAGVRLHRAREALRHRVIETCGTCVIHGCRDCECGEPRRHGATPAPPPARP